MVHLDGVRDATSFINNWRGDHARLVAGLAQQLTLGGPIAVKAADFLARPQPIAPVAHETLADFVTDQWQTHGPIAWRAPDGPERRSFQLSVQALAQLGDTRALPSILDVLDSRDGGPEDWRAAWAARSLARESAQLVPLLCAFLDRLDLTAPRSEHTTKNAWAALFALRELADPAGIPAIHELLVRAVRHDQWSPVISALEALRAFGIDARDALDDARPLITTAPEARIRNDALAVVWALSREPAEVMPYVRELLGGTKPYEFMAAAELIAEIGAPAENLLPDLRPLLDHPHDKVRLNSAVALWTLGGEAEAPAIMAALIGNWNRRSTTARAVIDCLDQMGTSAAPALPLVRNELAEQSRSGAYRFIHDDEALQETCRSIIARFD